MMLVQGQCLVNSTCDIDHDQSWIWLLFTPDFAVTYYLFRAEVRNHGLLAKLINIVYEGNFQCVLVGYKTLHTHV